MKHALGSITRRERRFAAAGVIIALTLLLPVVAVAEPGLLPGTGDPAQPGLELALDVERGDSCRDTLPADTPTYVVCRWLNPPQDAAQVATFWAADDGANLKAAQPLPARYVRCNQKTDLSTSSSCKGGETLCEQLPDDDWYQCTDQTTGQTTYERYVNGTRTVRTTPPTTATPKATMTSAPASAEPTATPTASTPLPTISTEPIDPTATATTPTPLPTVSAETTSSAGTGPLAKAVSAARSTTQRLRIWVESDLADDYAAGDPQFTTALNALIAAAKHPGVTGVKFADNLAYTNFTRAQDVTRFLKRASAALRAALPGKRLSIGVVVPELGCGSAKACIQEMRTKAPLATKENVTRYLKTAAVDRVEVSTGLFGRTYARHKVPDPKTGKPTPITPALAARAQWMSIRALEWDTLTQIGAREYGLAHAGATSPWDKATATAQIDARIGTAIAFGIPTITLWGHKTADGDQTYRLLDADLTPNAVWTALTTQRLRGRLAVILDPSSTERGVTTDLTELAKVASDVFILT
ncbi:hypothetical protein ACFFR3_19085 [Nonomuraea salmonea]|uniref:Uncharacterized protein n=1 Tax=Nonomuraea salmonea TaxID=46181 RepID=A0ABV5NN25_9ACTN